MEFPELKQIFIANTEQALASNPCWRYGQAMFNVNSGFFGHVRATALDPFYKSKEDLDDDWWDEMDKLYQRIRINNESNSSGN